MVPVTSYALPYEVVWRAPVAPGPCDYLLRVKLAASPTQEAADGIDSNIIPFCLLGTSGALAGVDIEPWKSTIKEWSSPRITGAAIEWDLRSVRVSPKAWVILAQLLLTNHAQHPIERVEIVGPDDAGQVTSVRAGSPLSNPYPEMWQGVSFAVSVDVSDSFTVRTEFVREPSAAEQALIDEELSAWAPALMIGAYGVAPVPPAECAARPDEAIVFVDDFLEWDVSDFRAHTAALDGLLNVIASISEKIVRVARVEIG